MSSLLWSHFGSTFPFVAQAISSISHLLAEISLGAICLLIAKLGSRCHACLLRLVTKLEALNKVDVMRPS
jgi:hypothetical protein